MSNTLCENVCAFGMKGKLWRESSFYLRFSRALEDGRTPS
jgi:hypothetical protein